MLNFDYLRDIPELTPLHELCNMCEQRQLFQLTTANVFADFIANLQTHLTPPGLLV